MKTRNLSFTLALVATMLLSPLGLSAQLEAYNGPLPSRTRLIETVQDEEPEDDTPDIVIEIDRTETVLGPKVMRLTLLDGSIITGELEQDTVSINTEFGTLQVPINRIKRLRPGLRSYPELHQRIQQLIVDLGGPEFEARENAQKELIGYGLRIQHIINRIDDEENAERKRRLDQIKQAFEDLEEEQQALPEDEPVRPWKQLDVIETDVFTIEGEVDLAQMEISSRYGQLTINLADIELADRMFGGREATRRGLTVEGTHLVQRNFKSSQLRVEKGDRITVVADGQIVMSPWGSNQMANPDGNSYYGMYNQFPGGALLGKIGNANGTEFLVGKRKTWIAQNSGVLSFAVAMQTDYSGGGYAFPGQYTLRITIDPQ